MSVTIIICFLQLVSVAGGDSTSDGNSIFNYSKSQAKYYISQVKAGTNIEENLWALTLLGSENSEIQSFIEKHAKEDEVLNIFTNFENTFQSQLRKLVFQTGSPNLLIALLLTAENTPERKKIYQEYISKYQLPANSEINYSKLAKTIINKEKVSTEFLPNKKFLLPHFFLLWDSSYSKFFTEKYYAEIKKSWSENYSSTTNLHNTLAELSYFRILYLTNNYSESVSLYNSLSDNKLLPNSTLKLKIHQFLDYTMYRLGYYDRSLNIVRNITIPLSQYLKQKNKELQLIQLQGVYLYSIGKIKAAEKIYREILEEINEKNLEISKSSLYNNLALTYHKLGKYDQFLDLQFQALETAEQSDNYSHQLKIFNNLFIYYKRNNDQTNALEYLEKAKNLAQEKGSNQDLGKIYLSLGTSVRQFNHSPQKAFEYFAKAEKVLDPENDFEHYIYLLIEQANTFEKSKNYSAANSKYDQILHLTPNKDNPFHIDALVNKALVNLEMERIGSTFKYIQTYKSFDLNQLDFEQLIKAKTVEADYLSQVGEPVKALDILEPTLKQIVVRAQGSTDLKSGFWHVEDEYLDAFELAATIYIETGQPEKAVEKLDQLKTINDASLYQNPLVKSSLLNESELTEYKQLTDRLDVVRKELLTAPEENKFAIQQQINRLNTKKRKYDRKLTKNIDHEPLSVQHIQNKLSAKELILHITELNDKYYIAKISRTNVNLNRIKLDEELRRLLTTSVEQVSTHETNLDSLYQIAQILDLEKIPDHIEKITVIPDSYFYQLPLDILPLENPTKSYSYGGTTYAVEKFSTQYLTSLEDFKKPNSFKSDSENPVNYVGYGISNFSNYNDQSLVSLPYAQSEVTNIAKTLSHLPIRKTFTNKQSTKAIFKQTAPNSRVIHLATHSEVSERDPMFSTVYFSKSGTEKDNTFDDRIFAYELFELNLSNDMIMLNSCESGSGSYIQGTGVMGIGRALQYAGAESLILNLWSVNDMLASDFAIYFYTQLNDGKSKDEALQATKQYFLNTKNANPHFWGPYMLIGNSEPIVEPHQTKNLAMAGIFIFYFLLMTGCSYLAQHGLLFTNRN